MKTTCYLQVEPKFGDYIYNRDELKSISVKRVTQKRPEYPLPGVVVKLNLDIPDAAFEPMKPEATVEIPVSHTEPVLVVSEPIEVVE